MSSCDCDHHAAGPKLKPIEEALEFLLQRAKPISDIESVPTGEALGRVLAAPVVSQVTVPPWNNSAMDGYAVRVADLDGERPRLPVSQRIPAGACGSELEPGTAARIFTGAPVPPGADAVVIQEVCEVDGEDVIITECPKPGANIRLAGEDIEQGAEVVAAGTRLAPQHLGLAASVGVAELQVYRRLKVAVFSSGDELVMPGGELGPGQIYNSNQFTLGGLLQALGCEVVQLGIVEDTFDATCEALSRGAEMADLVVASGGVSVGEEDHVKPAVEKLGSLDLWKIAIRPGKPLAFGHIGETPFIGTPGNPVSLFVTFCVFARPYILRSQGVAGDLQPKEVSAAAAFDWKKAEKRREYARARLVSGAAGELQVELYPSRSSGVLSSVAWADGLVVIPEGRTFSRGEPVRFIPYTELMS
ncbi:gephyrin-like molybdotransferase Glp [Candidatus Endoriftia persephone]|jgi:molybdopterin molybdotransferase|uniref:Molybdopterin molybdenumtransferase n=3 Tax=Gammaproteobacteria TaxID=1236 RepID=G2FFZ1_9GAMM|nr:gephyrin-like molybdotransferase Glp [Candidatus Endoriftia persephone]EGV52762.1 molybdopterin molybdenumtransferase [endosymbiont of Riftia pachyptila (vent Ph05)]EGW54224.1 molybdopterin molybdenumtransferase [endosymbiont of Tevnia jerichonana (vent Tica)]USF87476.1 molybdopterin molybdotransferase MoeA [Candidatus Endoriftia persephone]